MSKSDERPAPALFLVDLGRRAGEPFVLRRPEELIAGEEALLRARLEGDLAELGRIRGELPRTTCAECGRCCQRCESISAWSIEFHEIARYLAEEMPAEELRRLRRRVEFLFFSQVDFYRTFGRRTRMAQIPCPFLRPEGSGCIAYSVRPTTCRQYGLMGLAIDPANPCRRQCEPPCPNVRLHPEGASLGLDCCHWFGIPGRMLPISQYYVLLAHEEQLGNRFDLLTWLVHYFGITPA